MAALTNISTKEVWSLLEQVTDPEVPVLSIIDLGIVRDVQVKGSEAHIVITPTYSGCPAMDVISMGIRMQLLASGFEKVTISQVLSPAWTTDWMSEAGKEKLRAYGIAPPHPTPQLCNNKLFADEAAVQCPQCGSWHTRRISEFGSTACKSLYQCQDCREPFDYFKCH
ncbi:MAG: phenylacetate-CoA oxygenase subunit PaaJ [Candidatus Pseudobacter hemicellulosilyticus]|uniref:Phenylacetate-CoA oxygenase subunit PaaJ n=1 Tax=Candidatus Pseudobacter hemicellulosilyticus TaxID=3121375 RepID=A0AAJ5WS07_9BACT|nr:MAG: phenylacetate-CoA oxygenase subunit PaaJ [Pseudobacter sp.]